MITIEKLLHKHKHIYQTIVPFNAMHHNLVGINLTAANSTLTAAIVNNIDAFCQYIQKYLQQHKATYAVGGYNELRTLYGRSEVFNDAVEPRRLHIGIDIWGAEGTPVFAPLGGMIHSFAFNNTNGDYGATIILQHQLEGYAFHTLYGHLGKTDIDNLQEGMYITAGQLVGHFGTPEHNGNWPPHLHFQVIEDMQLKEGDYPGVCKASEASFYLKNCVNPSVLMGLPTVM